MYQHYRRIQCDLGCDFRRLSTFACETLARILFFLLVVLLVCHADARGHQSHGATPAGRLENRSSESHQEPYLPPTEAQSWREIQEAIRDGEKLKQRDPEPYYSRAEMWSKRLENQEEALLDTLRGVDALMQSDEWNNPDAKDRAFRQLRDTAWRSLDRPKSVYPGAARAHYGSGLSALGANDFQTAVDHFTRAIQLDANTPEYYYFRAIALKNLGNERRFPVISGASKGHNVSGWRLIVEVAPPTTRNRILRCRLDSPPTCVPIQSGIVSEALHVHCRTSRGCPKESL